jgi:VWFA-related protein
VTGLGRDAFEVFEDGRRQELAYFAEGTAADELPLRLGLLLDTSGSMELDLKDAATAVIRFIDTFEAATDVTFVDFDTTVQLGRFSPGSYPMLYERIRSRKAGRNTALYDAVGVYLQAVASRRGQHVLVIYSDGGDTASALGYPQLQQMLRAADVLVYAIGYLENQPGGARVEQQLRLTQLARETGGEVFFPLSRESLEEAYARILEQINARYTLGYVSPDRLRPGFHRIDVRLVDRDEHEDYAVRTRPGYHIYDRPAGR